jgi:hypothetical protein
MLCVSPYLPGDWFSQAVESMYAPLAFRLSSADMKMLLSSIGMKTPLFVDVAPFTVTTQEFLNFSKFNFML